MAPERSELTLLPRPGRRFGRLCTSAAPAVWLAGAVGLALLLGAATSPLAHGEPPGGGPPSEDLGLHLSAFRVASADGLDAAAELAFALDALERECGHFFELKGIKWKRVAKELTPLAEEVETPGELHYLLTKLIARLRDGHAAVRVLDDSLELEWPEEARLEGLTGPGMFLCQVGKKLYVKESFKTALDLGLKPGSELTEIEGEKPLAWLEEHTARLCDTSSFSTEQHARAAALSWGLAQPANTRLELEFKEPGSRKKKSRTLTYSPKVSSRHNGPAVMPEGLDGDGDVRWATLESGHGWIHFRKCPGDLPERIDAALSGFGEVPGIVLDFRGCGGGGFDHEALFGRFVPAGETFGEPKKYASVGPAPYAGPLVVIVDGLTVSAGETGSGMFKEDGRAYMIGESSTAGMSSQKTTIELPSGQFALYVSVRSNKSQFNDGRGIEGIGVPPDELVEYEPEDLAEGRDTLIERAVELLDDMPKGVLYRPGQFGFGE